MTRTPNFFIIGAPKCGTTSMATWLAEHPRIYMSPIKEPFYFSADIKYRKVYKWSDYSRLFVESRLEHIAVGEASTFYLFSKVAVTSIEEELPGSRYIVMVRNPLEMAPALHEQHVRAYIEDNANFSRCWSLSKVRRSGLNVPPGCKDPSLLDYQTWCLLGQQIERLYSIVPRDRVQVLVLDDIKADPRREYLKVLDFLGVPDDGRLNFPAYNPAREWRSKGIGNVVRSFGLWVAWARHIAQILPRRSFGTVGLLERLATRQRQRSPLPPELRVEMEEFYRDDIQLLEKLLNRSLQFWM